MILLGRLCLYDSIEELYVECIYVVSENYHLNYQVSFVLLLVTRYY